jgi:hypothetical protein
MEDGQKGAEKEAVTYSSLGNIRQLRVAEKQRHPLVIDRHIVGCRGGDDFFGFDIVWNKEWHGPETSSKLD